MTVRDLASPIPLAIVVAIGRNGEMGQGGALPWRMPGDLARFKALTIGKPMIMGRRTFESIGRALPGRESIVATRSQVALPPGVHRAASAADAWELAQVRAAALGADEIALIGGASLFEEMMPRVDRVYMTLVDMAPQADTFFPPLDATKWHEIRRERPPRHPGDDAPCLFIDYVRTMGAAS